MYKIVDADGNVFVSQKYDKESEFERMVVENAAYIFGKDGIYFDIKKKIGTPKKGAAIPDGYFLDLTFHNDPRLYIVEIELNSHDVYGHIGEQILRFGISSETDKHRMKQHLLGSIDADAEKQTVLSRFFEKSRFTNKNELLDKVIFDSRPAAIIVIDEATDELYNVMGQLTMATEVIEAQTYVCGEKRLHRFRPLHEDILSDLPDDEDADELDTIIVPAREDGFKEEFLNNKRWYAIRISSAMLGRIKYIAAYRVAPVSAITYIAEVGDIRKYGDTNKYIVHFKEDTLRKIDAVGLGKKKGIAPQSPRYSSLGKILNAKTLDDIWG